MASTDLFPLDPDYTLPQEPRDGVVREAVTSGRMAERLVAASQRAFALEFSSRSTDDKEMLEDWWARFADKYFIFNHKAWVNNAGVFLARKFPVRFGGPPRYALVANEAYEMGVTLIEAAGETLQAGDYPDPTAGHPTFFQEETEVTKKVGTWTTVAHANYRGGSALENANTNATDFVRFVYGGYGFRFWNRKNPGFGIYQVKLDGAVLGTVDLYNAADLASAVVFTKLDVALGLHWLDIVATNTKNAAATGQLIHADALEVIP